MSVNVGDQHVKEFRIRVTRIHEESEMFSSGMGSRVYPVMTGRYVSFILVDFSDKEITLPETQFNELIRGSE